MKSYTYIKPYFEIEVIATGFVSLAALIVCPYLAWKGVVPGIMIVLMVPAFYQAWNTFIAIANPETVTTDDESIEFSAWGRVDKYNLSDVETFQVREFPSAGKMYIRIDGGGLLRGRYWLQTRVMTDGKELFFRICDMEYRKHPDTLKARARRTNSEFIEADVQPSSTSRRHHRRKK